MIKNYIKYDVYVSDIDCEQKATKLMKYTCVCEVTKPGNRTS